jgi:hypothetical protein
MPIVNEPKIHLLRINFKKLKVMSNIISMKNFVATMVVTTILTLILAWICLIWTL